MTGATAQLQHGIRNLDLDLVVLRIHKKLSRRNADALTPAMISIGAVSESIRSHHQTSR
jgi:hypothetical protein